MTWETSGATKVLGDERQHGQPGTREPASMIPSASGSVSSNTGTRILRENMAIRLLKNNLSAA
jgi:hypothetical protein